MSQSLGGENGVVKNSLSDTENKLMNRSFTHSKMSCFSSNLFRKKKKQYFKKFLREKAIKKLKESFKKLKSKRKKY